MKVVVIAPVFWPATKFGGPVYTMTALVKALARRGENVVVITGNLDNTGKVDEKIGVPVEFHGARLIYLNQIRTPPYGPLDELEEYLDREANDADILLISSTLTRTSWQAFRWAKKNNKSYIVTTRGHLVRRHWWKDFKKYIAVQFILRRHLENATFLQATSFLEAEALQSYGFQNVSIVPHGIDLPGDLPERIQSRKDWQVKEGETVMIALGRLHPVKGLELLIEAASFLAESGQNIKLMIAGQGEPGYLKELKELVFQLGLVEQCRFVGQVDGQEKWSLLRAGDLFVHLSTGESFGVVIGEALGAGLPVLIGDKCGWEEIEQLGFGKRVFRSLDAVISGMEQMISESNHPEIVRENAPDWVKEKFSWDNISTEMVSLFDRGISAGNNGSQD